MAEGVQPLSALLPPSLTAPFRWMVYFGILATTVGSIFHPIAGAGLLVTFLICDQTRLKKFLGEPSGGILFLFMALYLWEPSVLMLILFTIYFQATYLWGGKKPAHYLWIASVGFIHLAVVSTIMSSVVFPLIFAGFVILLTRVLLLCDFLTGITLEDGALDRRELARCERSVVQRMKVVSYWIAGISILIAIIIFPLLPRVEGISYQPSQFTQESVSGFSDEVTLGQMGAIQTDNRIALRIFMPKILNQRIWRWRGAALEKFDYNAQKWSSDSNPMEVVGSSGQISLYHDKVPLEKEKISVNVSSMADPRIFLPEVDGRMPWMVARIQGDFERVGFDPDSWTLQPRSDLRYRGFDYTLRLIQSDVAYDYRPQPGEIDPAPLRDCLSLATVPGGFIQRLEERGEELAPGFKTRAIDPLELTQTLSVGLQTSQAYTLDFTEPNSATSLEDFIFEKKAGNCEYFATALALLLRNYGIPARLVTGFQSGRENLFHNYLMIRQSDAHSWVEAYLDDRGWITFDPTPSSNTPVSYLMAHLGVVADVYDFLQLQWNNYVLDYSQSDQKEFFTKIFETGFFEPRNIFNIGWWIYMARPMIALILFLVFLAWLIREVSPDFSSFFQALSLDLPSFSWFRRRRSSGYLATRLFLKLERSFSRRGIPRASSETPLAYMSRIAAAYPHSAPLCTRFAALYNMSRFGGVSELPEWSHEFRNLATDLIQQTRNNHK
ncbi:MAG: DUF3488 domain-containing protein [Candidatus Omnitrophica bacterium]|nr:DUF3488 domain-containing protein [Candidatus Omnitrophota bacterium]